MTDSLTRAYYDRAAIIPGHSCTRSKSPGKFYALDAGPLYALNGYESTLVDVEGKPYIDMLCALGAISLGYRGGKHWGPGVFSLPHALEVEAAEMVLRHVAPWAGSVRFTKTGSEATHAAYRIAKKVTGRDHVLMGDWAYHGWHEWCDDPRYPYARRFPYGMDLNRYDDRILGPDIAAVFIEPPRWIPSYREWLLDVRAFCDRMGALLVFDSMIYGGRWALGGASEWYGVIPDMEVFGKGVGNGHSVACVVGNEPVAQHGELVSGTYSGDAVGLSALCETLRVYLDQPVIATMWMRGEQLARGLQDVCDLNPSLEAVVEGKPVHQRIRFKDPTMGKLFTAKMAQRGVLMHPDVINICFAHTKEQINQVIDAALMSARELAHDTLRASV